MARPFLLGVARQFTEAGLSSAAARLAAASSSGSSSAPAYVFEVYASETILAALRASVASAARHAGSLLVESSKGVRNIPLFLLEQPGVTSASAAAERVDSHSTARSPSSACLRSASAAGYRAEASHLYKDPSSESASASFASSPASADCAASSTTAMSPSAPPSGSLIVALHANEWLRESLGTSPTIAAAHDESCFLTPTTSPVFIPTPSDARAAAHLPQYSAFISSPMSLPRSRAYSTGLVFNNLPPGFLTLEELIAMLDKTDLTIYEEIIFRWAFNKRYTNGKVSFKYFQENAKDRMRYTSNFLFQVEDLLLFLKKGKYTFQELVRIQKLLNHVACPQKERMHIVVKESLIYNHPSEDKANGNPVLARIETKLDVIRKLLEEHNMDAQKLSEFLYKKKPAWGSANVFGRNMNVARITGFLWRILFGGAS